MTIDVVLANYNHGNFISNAIKSLNYQSIKPSRIIIIDDHSSDNSKFVLNSELDKYQNILLINNTHNLGAVKSYNLGLASVVSEYVYFAAADDATFPLLFQKSIEMLKRYPKSAFSCAEAIVRDRDTGVIKYRPLIRPSQKSVFLTPRQIAKEFKHNDNWIQTGTCVYRTNIIKDLGGFDESLGAFSDSMLAKQLSMTYGCVFIKYYGVKWNISNSGFSRNSILTLSEFKTIKNNLKTYVLSSKAFPDWYWSVYSSRLDSMFYRNMLKNNMIGLEETNKKYLRQFFSIYRKSGSFGKKIINVLLQLLIFLRFHPFSVAKLVKTAIIRIFESHKGKNY